MKKRILVVDDEESIRWVLGKCLEKEGYTVEFGEDGSEGIDKALSGNFSSIILDITMPDMTGFDVLNEIKSKGIESPVIIITAQNTVKNAIDAMKQGAYDYIAKPFDLDEVKITVARAIQSYENSKKLDILLDESTEIDTLQDIVGQSQAMLNIYKMIGRVAERDITVLVNGESGTGKELVARAIHTNSMRRDKKLVAVNIAAIPKELLESELFGYQKGAFTGASISRQGRFEEADGGTLHLDEIGDMPHELQTKLLRILEEKKLYKLGSEKPSPIDVRIVASTNKNLEKEVEDGNFREDLYYRLNAITIKIPPLRNRIEDVIPLTEHFLSKYGKELGVGTRTLSDKAKETITSYNWPGNVRELENIIKRMLVLSSDSVITRETLLDAAPHLEGKGRESQESLDSLIKNEINLILDNQDEASADKIYETIIKKVEKPLIELILETTNGNKKKAALILGINRNTLSKKMEELGFQEKDKEL
ncbi:MAG: sigma-54 dependent transcriptional regulator [Thermodesulfobacteriota bacterium]